MDTRYLKSVTRCLFAVRKNIYFVGFFFRTTTSTYLGPADKLGTRRNATLLSFFLLSFDWISRGGREGKDGGEEGGNRRDGGEKYVRGSQVAAFQRR